MSQSTTGPMNHCDIKINHLLIWLTKPDKINVSAWPSSPVSGNDPEMMDTKSGNIQTQSIKINIMVDDFNPTIWGKYCCGYDPLPSKAPAVLDTVLKIRFLMALITL